MKHVAQPCRMWMLVVYEILYFVLARAKSYENETGSAWSCVVYVKRAFQAISNSLLTEEGVISRPK